MNPRAAYKLCIVYSPMISYGVGKLSKMEFTRYKQSPIGKERERVVGGRLLSRG
jgi:hypothetical protein